MFRDKIAAEGLIVEKTTPALIRPAIVGEYVQTIVKGRVISFTQVDTEDLWVVRGPLFKELYVLSDEKFRANWDVNGEEIDAQGVDGLLKAQKFLRHKPKAGN